ncbi:hypothetical protein B0H11DRAFT_689996 [Mycena galericulata]|nr:hypothetical protein B0H11DRAFT_689996 [Mycena galericulata]
MRPMQYPHLPLPCPSDGCGRCRVCSLRRSISVRDEWRVHPMKSCVRSQWQRQRRHRHLESHRSCPHIRPCVGVLQRPTPVPAPGARCRCLYSESGPRRRRACARIFRNSQPRPLHRFPDPQPRPRRALGKRRVAHARAPAYYHDRILFVTSAPRQSCMCGLPPHLRPGGRMDSELWVRRLSARVVLGSGNGSRGAGLLCVTRHCVRYRCAD